MEAASFGLNFTYYRIFINITHFITHLNSYPSNLTQPILDHPFQHFLHSQNTVFFLRIAPPRCLTRTGVVLRQKEDFRK